MIDVDHLPRWSTADLHESMTARSFVDSFEATAAAVTRLEVQFDHEGVDDTDDHVSSGAVAARCSAIITAYNEVAGNLATLDAFIRAGLTADSRDDLAQARSSELLGINARMRSLLARLAAWAAELDLEALAELSDEVAAHLGPLRRLADRAVHQMPRREEELYAELTTTGWSAWRRLREDVTSRLTTTVVGFDDGVDMPLAAVRGLATHRDPSVRRAAYDAELAAWPRVAVPCAAAVNAIKGEANTVNRRRGWASPMDASLFANSVSPATFAAMQAAVDDALPALRRWMRTKATLHGHIGGLPWWDLVAPLPFDVSSPTWADGVAVVRDAFSAYSPSLGALVDRSLDEAWIDAGPREGKVGGAFCQHFFADRSLILLNWTDSLDSVRTTAHELGHAYHNTQLAHRTALQRRLPMALAETASIFCETLVVERALDGASGADRLAILDLDLRSAVQVIVDIRSRVLFESAVFDRRGRRSLAPRELDSVMVEAQAAAYGDGLDSATAHPSMWIVKPHYYSSHFYNWPYTYGLLFGLGLFTRYRADPERFQHRYDDVLSRAGIDSAEELASQFGFDVTDQGFWRDSLDVVAGRIAEYERLAREVVAP